MTGPPGKSLDINLSPSLWLTTVLSVTHAGAVVCLLIAPASLAVKLVLPLPAVASFVYCLRRYARLAHPRSARRLVFGETHRRLFFNDRPRSIDIELLPGTVSTRYWVILRAAVKNGRRLALPLAGDMMSADQWRRLRVWLTVESQTGDKGQDAR